ncbi:hypothetical protein [Actinoplanes couchii]|nr:hypothetical protein [Actinoplanes couchii]MDR6324522.1 hypothetical protein [Actinoplanes couchii]
MLDGKVSFHTGRAEAHARAGARRRLPGEDGLDMAVGGIAAIVTDNALLYRLAALYREP